MTETSAKVCFFKEIQFRLPCHKQIHSFFDLLECIGQLRVNACLRATDVIWENCFAKHKFIQISSLLCRRSGCWWIMSRYRFRLRVFFTRARVLEARLFTSSRSRARFRYALFFYTWLSARLCMFLLSVYFDISLKHIGSSTCVYSCWMLV